MIVNSPFNLFNICFKKNQKNLIFDIIYNLYENNQKIPKYLINLLKKFDLNDEILNEILI